MSPFLLALPGIVAAALSWSLTPLCRRLAMRVGAIDRPDARKVHREPMPRLGGLAVVASGVITLGVMCAAGVDGMPALGKLCAGVGLGLLPILAVSIRDDIRPMQPLPRLIAQAVGAATVMAFGVHLASEVHLFGYALRIGWLALPISFLWIVGVTNAFNLVDGLDGLSAGLGLISALSLAAVFVMSGHQPMATAAIVMAGALFGFLPYNLYPAKIFLGDSGATAIGFALACFTLQGGSRLSAGFATLMPIIVIGLPVADTLVSMARRALRRLERQTGHRVFGADRNHIHHRLLALGLDHKHAVRLLHAVAMAGALVALVSIMVSTRRAAFLLAGLLIAGFVGLARLGYEEFAVVRRGLVLRFYEAPVLRRSFFAVFVDLLFVSCAIYLAIGLKFDDWGLERNRQMAFEMVSALVPTTVVTFWLMGMYRGAWRLAGVEDFARTIRAVLTASAAGYLGQQLFYPDPAPGAVVLIYTLLKLAMANASRGSYRLLASGHLPGADDRIPVLIYGAGAGGVAALRELRSNHESRMAPAGFLDDDPGKMGRRVNGLPVLGPLEALEAAMHRTRALRVVVSSRRIPEARLARAAELCAAHGLELLRMEIRFGAVGNNTGNYSGAEPDSGGWPPPRPEQGGDFGGGIGDWNDVAARVKAAASGSVPAGAAGRIGPGVVVAPSSAGPRPVATGVASVVAPSGAGSRAVPAGVASVGATAGAGLRAVPTGVPSVGAPSGAGSPAVPTGVASVAEPSGVGSRAVASGGASVARPASFGALSFPPAGPIAQPVSPGLPLPSGAASAPAPSASGSRSEPAGANLPARSASQTSPTIVRSSGAPTATPSSPAPSAPSGLSRPRFGSQS